MRKNISSSSPFEDTIGFSRAVRVGNIITVSGTAPIAPEGGTHAPGDVYEQTRRCLQIAQTAIENAGGVLEHVVRTRIMLVDITNWRDAARAHGECFAKIKPACTFVEISRFVQDDWLVEIECDCVVENP